MKTSNKLLIGTGICIILGIFSYAFVLRGAYQKALAKPSDILSEYIEIPLKPAKYLNLDFDGALEFKYGEKYAITVRRGYKDSLVIGYQGDTLNLNARKVGIITITSPEIPILNSYSSSKEKSQNNGEEDEENYDFNISVVSFQSGSFVAKFQKSCKVDFHQCNLEKIDVKNQEFSEINLDATKVKQLNINLPKLSTLNISYSNIQSKNIVLGDSCSVNISGKQSQIDFLK
jgi:hypothetical protein